MLIDYALAMVSETHERILKSTQTIGYKCTDTLNNALLQDEVNEKIADKILPSLN